MNERGNSCYANATLQVLLRSEMSVTVLAGMRESMKLYTDRLARWWNLNPWIHATIWQTARDIRAGAGNKWRNFAEDFFVFFVTDMYAHGLVPDATDANFEKVAVPEVHLQCRQLFCVFAAEYVMCDLQRRMQDTPSGRRADHSGFGVSVTQVLDLLYFASTQTDVHRNILHGTNQHDAGEFMSFVLEALSIGTSRTIFVGLDTETLRTLYCLDPGHGDLVGRPRTEKGSCFMTLNLGVEGDETPRDIEFYLKDGHELFEKENEANCDKCKKLTEQAQISLTTFDAFACFYTVEARRVDATAPGASGRVNSNLYHMRITQFISLRQTKNPETTERYELIAVIHHRVAHYVAYVKVGKAWILYNDVDVTVSSLEAATTGDKALGHSPHLIFYKRLPPGPLVLDADAARVVAAEAAARRAADAARRGNPKPTGEAATRAGAADMLRGFAAAAPHARAPAASATARAAPAGGAALYLQIMDIKKKKVPVLSPFGTWKDRKATMLPWVAKHAALHGYYTSLPDNHAKTRFWQTMEGLIREVNKPIPQVETLTANVKAHVTLRADEILTLMANAFFGIFDDFSGFKLTSVLHGSVRHNRVNHVIRGAEEKMKCIWNYLSHQISALTTPSDRLESPAETSARMLLCAREVTFTRDHVDGGFEKDFWRNHPTATILTVTCHTDNLDDSFIKIEEVCDTLGGQCWEVDFANKNIGGGALGNGLVQEEIRFLQCPELAVSKFFVDEIRTGECIRIEGYRQFNETLGYAEGAPSAALGGTAVGVVKEPFHWVKHKDAASEPLRRRMIAIDAIKYIQANVQFRMFEIDRELHKAYVGFLTGDNLPISTGHWGGGDFNGNKKLKAVIQMLAAGMAGKNLHYCVFGDDAGIERLATALAGRNVRDVYRTLQDGIRSIDYTQFDHKTQHGRDLIEKFFLDLWPRSL